MQVPENEANFCSLFSSSSGSSGTIINLYHEEDDNAVNSRFNSWKHSNEIKTYTHITQTKQFANIIMKPSIPVPIKTTHFRRRQLLGLHGP